MFYYNYTHVYLKRHIYLSLSLNKNIKRNKNGMLSDIASFLSRSECDGGVVHCKQDMMSSCVEEVKSGKWDFNGKWPNLEARLHLNTRRSSRADTHT